MGKKLNIGYPPSFSKIGWDLLFCLTATLAWSLPTLFNQFPLSYFDSRFYIHNALHIVDPASVDWRPITYSLFIWLPLKFGGFKAVIYFQNFLLSFTLLYYSKWLNHKIERPHFLLLIALLALTPITYLSNFLMPDVFTGLSILMLAWAWNHRGKEQGVLWLLAGFFSFFHFISLMFSLTASMFFLVRKKARKSFVLVALIIITSLVNFAFFTPKTGFQKSVHYHFYSRLAAYEITPDFYKEFCPTPELSNIEFCRTDKSFQIWGDKNSNDLFIPSDELLPSIVKVNQKILFSKYMGIFLWRSIKNCFLQISLFAAPMPIVTNNLELSLTYSEIQDAESFYYKYPQLFKNDENNLNAFYEKLAIVFFITFMMSLLSLAPLYFRNKLNEVQKHTVNFLITFYLFNCVIVGFFSEPQSRYGNRLLWPFSFVLLCYLLPKLVIKAKKNEAEYD